MLVSISRFSRRCDEFVPGMRHGILISSKQKVMNLNMKESAEHMAQMVNQIELDQNIIDLIR